mmetsp:Transcript_60813/g.168261  ORF Transcript_60813/g.168261 Transcript_60813/m.168261 type:complete len:426 (+) Transcript_60813:1027-2304(+)
MGAARFGGPRASKRTYSPMLVLASSSGRPSAEVVLDPAAPVLSDAPAPPASEPPAPWSSPLPAPGGVAAGFSPSRLKRRRLAASSVDLGDGTDMGGKASRIGGDASPLSPSASSPSPAAPERSSSSSSSLSLSSSSASRRRRAADEVDTDDEGDVAKLSIRWRGAAASVALHAAVSMANTLPCCGAASCAAPGVAIPGDTTAGTADGASAAPRGSQLPLLGGMLNPSASSPTRQAATMSASSKSAIDSSPETENVGYQSANDMCEPVSEPLLRSRASGGGVMPPSIPMDPKRPPPSGTAAAVPGAAVGGPAADAAAEAVDGTAGEVAMKIPGASTPSRSGVDTAVGVTVRETVGLHCPSDRLEMLGARVSAPVALQYLLSQCDRLSASTLPRMLSSMGPEPAPGDAATSSPATSMGMVMGMGGVA